MSIFDLVLLSSCENKEQALRAPEEETPVMVTVSGVFPESLQAATKVTFNNVDSLIWEPTDAVALLIGGESSTSSRVNGNNSLAIRLSTKLDDVDGTPLPGIFRGPVTFGSFRHEDIRGVVYPYKPAQYFRRQWSGGDAIRNYRIGMQVGGAPQADGNFLQTQSRPGVLNGENIALFSLFGIEDAESRMSGDNITFEGMEFQWGCSLLCFNIYGKAYGMEDDEVLKSITLHPGNIALAGEQEWNYTDQAWVFTGSSGKTITVNLEDSTGATIADKTKDNGLKIYMSTRTGDDYVATLAGIASLTVTTDRNSYVIPVSAHLNLQPGHVMRIGINLKNHFPEPYVVKSTEYSVDNATWSEDLPSTFSKLYVKGNSDSEVLSAIRTAVDAQPAPVELDFSQADYESATFPATFTECKKVKSIKFQSNIKFVEAAAFKSCSELVEADVAQIEGYGDESFMGTSLKKVRLDNNVTSLGISTFRDIYTLEEVYYNPADPVLKEYGNSGRKDMHTFRWESGDADSHFTDLVFTVGPGAILGRYSLAYNGNLTKLIFEAPEATTRQGNQSVYRDRFLRWVEFKGTPLRTTEGGLAPYISMGGSTESVIGGNATLPKYVVVPDGAAEAYLEMTAKEGEPLYVFTYQLIRILVNNSGFTIVEAGSVPADPTPEPADYLWSTDGVNWADEAPSSAFSTLYIKGELTATDMPKIRQAIDAQETAVTLDLSQATYENETFPATFGSATAEQASQKILSIVFPSNVTAVATDAFYNCGALESVKLDGIAKIGGNAFRATGLKTLTVPASVTEYTGTYAFAYCWQLQELHYYSAAPNTVSGTATDLYVFAMNNKAEYDELPEIYHVGLIPLTAYFYEGSVIPTYCFATNHKLTKVVFHGAPSATGNAWLIRARFLQTVDCRELTTDYTSVTGNSASIGEKVTGAKQILVPNGKYANFNAGLWKALVENNGFEIVDPLHTDGGAQYSADNATWGDAIPASFTTLYVKGNLTAENLASIKTAIETQGTTVALDFSACSYDSAEFPAVFGGTASANNGQAGAAVIATAGTAISSIKFPANVNSIATSAFRACDKLTSVDLTGIVTIGGSAFANTGIVSLTVPESVTTCGTYAFAYCPDLETVVWNSPATNSHAISWRGAADNANNVASKPLTVTFGAGVALGSGQCFDTNHKLVKVIFAGDPASVGSGWIIRCTSIHTFDLRALTKAVGSSPSNLGSVGDGVPTETPKVIIVADGLKEEFAANTIWGYLANNKGYTIKAVSEIE